MSATITSKISSSVSHPEKSLKGFALYVGLGDDALLAGDEKLHSLITQLREHVATIDPTAETYAALAFAPSNLTAKNLNVVRLALHEPQASGAALKANPTRKTGVTIDFTRASLYLDGTHADLNFREFKLLKFLVLREGLNVTREEIASFLEVSTSEGDSSSRAVDVQIRRLRAKLGEYHGIIRTVRGSGYRFDRHADVYIKHASAPSPDRV